MSFLKNKKYFLLFTAAFLCNVIITNAQQQTILRSINYNNGEFLLTAQQRDSLKMWFAPAQLAQIYRIDITGFADSTGDEMQNQALSESRAREVFMFLLGKGIDRNILKTAGKGVWYGTGTPGRRTDITLYIRTKEPGRSLKGYPSVSSLHKQLSQPQHFIVKARKDTLIMCKNGTVIYLKNNSFLMKKNTQQINLEVKEANTLDCMIAEGLTTMSSGRWLETGGMIYINASVDGEPLQINKDEGIGIMMPSNTQGSMYLWAGKPSADKEINWVRASSRPVDAATGAALGQINSIVKTTGLYITKTYGKGNYISDYELKNAQKALNHLFGRQANITGPQLTLERDMNYYIFTLTELGWANCDVFSDNDAPKVNFSVNIPSDSGTEVILIYHQKTMVKGSPSKDSSKTWFSAPIKEPVTLLMLTYTDGKPSIGKKDIVVTGDAVTSRFNLQTAAGPDEFRDLLKKMVL